MDEARYFYSKTGEDVNGPVTESALRQLFHEKFIDSTSFLCREGDTEWAQLDPGSFVEQPVAPPAPQPKATPSKRPRKKKPWYSKEGLSYPGVRQNLAIVYGLGAFFGAVINVHLRYVVFADSQAEPSSLVEVLGVFLGVMAGLALAGYLLSLCFPDFLRNLVRAISVFGFAVLLAIFQYVYLANTAGDHSAAPPPANPPILGN